MLNYVRSCVSENRYRFIDQGINLDLSYVTDRIIAMSYPSSGLEGLYRNSFKQVKRFLDTRHRTHYKVYNLRSERQYPQELFEGAAVDTFPFDDHQAPPFQLLVEFCKDAKAWLDKDTDNIVAIHCKAGKGRTGTVIAALLLYLGQAANADEAIRIYGEKRTTDGKGITIPSQIRYVRYFERWMTDNKAASPESRTDATIRLTQLMVCNIPHVYRRGTTLSMTIHIEQVQVFESVAVEVANDATITMAVPSIQVRDDFKITLFTAGLYSKRYLCHFWLNAHFASTSKPTVVLTKDEIDGAFKDTQCQLFPEDFAVQIQFSLE